jgi:hypothetical protein
LLRAQLFAVGGRELVCPVPTVDGEFVSLADVYRGWMDDGRGEGIGLQFKSPFTGKSFIFLLVMCNAIITLRVAGRDTCLATPAVISMVGRVACVAGVSMTLPFKVQYAGDAVDGWMDFPLVDQLLIVAQLCRYCAFKMEQSVDRFSVFSGGALFILQLTEHEVSAWIESLEGVRHRAVRMSGVGEFFKASHLSFSVDIDP